VHTWVIPPHITGNELVIQGPYQFIRTNGKEKVHVILM
jgi:hypothetical protein